MLYSPQSVYAILHTVTVVISFLLQREGKREKERGGGGREREMETKLIQPPI